MIQTAEGLIIDANGHLRISALDDTNLMHLVEYHSNRAKGDWLHVVWPEVSDLEGELEKTEHTDEFKLTVAALEALKYVGRRLKEKSKEVINNSRGLRFIPANAWYIIVQEDKSSGYLPDETPVLDDPGNYGGILVGNSMVKLAESDIKPDHLLVPASQGYYRIDENQYLHLPVQDGQVIMPQFFGGIIHIDTDNNTYRCDGASYPLYCFQSGAVPFT